MQRLAPLAQRLATDFTTDPRFDNPRAVQIRLPGFTRTRWWAWARPSATSTRQEPRLPTGSRTLADDAYIADLARPSAGALGGKVGVAPRLFLKKLVGDVLDRIDQFEDFDPRQHYQLTVRGTNSPMSNAIWRAAASADDVDLDAVMTSELRRTIPSTGSTRCSCTTS